MFKYSSFDCMYDEIYCGLHCCSRTSLVVFRIKTSKGRTCILFLTSNVIWDTAGYREQSNILLWCSEVEWNQSCCFLYWNFDFHIFVNCKTTSISKVSKWSWIRHWSTVLSSTTTATFLQTKTPNESIFLKVARRLRDNLLTSSFFRNNELSKAKNRIALKVNRNNQIFNWTNVFMNL